MSGRVGAGLLVKVAKRQYMVAGLRNYHISSNVIPTYMRKTKLNLDTPARSLHLISWNGSTFNESRAWSPLVRNMSTAPSVHRVNVAENATSEDNNEAMSNQESPKSKNAVQMEKSNYWGVAPKVHLKEDGTPWNWHCFSPHEAYAPDVTIDLTKHHKPENWTDSIAFWTVKSLRLPTDLFFRKRYGCRAMMLETVAAVPGMVGGMLLHFKSLRRFETSGGWIKALLEEAENERMHLMTFMEVAKPAWYERALVITVQGIFFNAYFLLYLMSPKLAHRITGYLEEEAIYSYTMFLNEIDKGNIPNGPAPPIAIDYWRLPKDATIRDVVMVVRADEAHHRDVNHFAADIHKQGKQLRELPAPVGYH